MSNDLATSVFERIPSLDGTNYRSWAFSLKMLLMAKELWGYVDGSLERPTDSGKLQSTWNTKDQLALSNTALSLKPSEQEHIYHCTTAKTAWDQLEEIYSGSGMHRLLSLMKHLTHLKLENQGMKEYIREVRQTANQIAEIGYKLANPIIITYILNGLPEKYRYLVVNLESQVETINFQDLTARLIDEGEREGTEVLVKSEDIKHRVLVTRGTSLGMICAGCGRMGHTEEKCFGSGRCNYCGGPGHDEDNCYCKRFRNGKGIMEMQRPKAPPDRGK